MRRTTVYLAITAACTSAGCRTWPIEQTDLAVYRLIENRQLVALGTTTDARLGDESGEVNGGDSFYDFTPRSLDAGIPEAFKKPRARAAETPDDSDEDQGADAGFGGQLPKSVFTDEERKLLKVFGLQDALAYAMRHGRQLQDAKEDLYLAALDLTLERHLWTPQFVASVQADYEDFPKEDVLDRAFTTVSEVSVSQRLPYGGEVTARAIHSLTRQVQQFVSDGETGQVILDAELPLLRGAGRVARESRYTAERELVYAVRRYERFRRSFVVNIAAAYFNLQGSKASIANTHKSYLNRKRDWEKAEFIHRMGRSRNIAAAPRAKENFRDSEARLVSAKEQYLTALDRFKIQLGMSVDTLLDVIPQGQDEASSAVDDLLPDIVEQDAVAVALTYRLDLLNSADQVDDVRRGVLIARNRLLPDLDVTAGVTLDSDADQRGAATLGQERATWRGGVQLRIDDRRTEQNAYRSSLVSRSRAQRDHEEFTDSVRADVRRAVRRIRQQENLRRIQKFNVQENAIRVAGARAQVDLGRADNQEVVDAETALLGAENRLADAVAAYRIAVLEFRRDTGTLRVSDNGRWVDADAEVPGVGDPDDEG